MTQSFLRKFIIGLIAVSFLTPLLLFPSSYIFPFIVPKIIFFRTIVLLMLGAYILLLIGDTSYRPRFHWMNIVVLSLLASYIISTFVGVDWYRSFWDNHERMLGLFTIFHYIVYFFVVSAVVRGEVEWKFLMRVFLLSGTVVMCIGLWQRFVDPEALLNRGSNRVSATLGNAIYFSGYGLFLFVLGILLALRERVLLWKMVAALGGLFGFIGIFLGGTRGTLLGLLIGLFFVPIIYLFTLKGRDSVKKWGIVSLAGLVLILGLLFTFRQHDAVKNIPALGRLLNTTLQSDTANTRIMAWKIAVDAWGEYPIFGWGPNNYYYAFNKYYNPAFMRHGIGETWFDNAHSVVMNTLAARGIIGLSVYILLFVVAILSLFIAFRRSSIDVHQFVWLTVFFVAHFIHNLFVFENPTSYLYFFFFLALVSSLSYPKKEMEVPKQRGISTGLGILIFALVLVLVYATDVNPAKANKGALKLIRNLHSGQFSLTTYQNTVAIPTPHVDDIRNDFSREAMAVISEYGKVKETKKAEELYSLVELELKKNLTLHPLDIRIHIQLAQLFQLKAQITQNATPLLEAERLLTDALALSTKRQQLLYSLSGIKWQLGMRDEAIQLIQRSIDDDSQIGEGWMRLALFYENSGRHEEAVSVITEAKNSGARFNDQERAVISKIEGATGTAP